MRVLTRQRMGLIGRSICFRHQRHSNSLDRHQGGPSMLCLRNPRQGVLPCVTACRPAKLSLQTNASHACSLTHIAAITAPTCILTPGLLLLVTAGSFSIVSSPVARTTHPQPNRPHVSSPSCVSAPNTTSPKHSTRRSRQIAHGVPSIARSTQDQNPAHL